MQIPSKVAGYTVQHVHKRFSGATTFATVVSALGTGLSIVPIYFRFNGSVAASMFLTIGSGGASIFRTRFVVSNAEMNTPWWDSTYAANTPILIEMATDPGVGEFDIWFIAMRTGAGQSGTGQ